MFKNLTNSEYKPETDAALSAELQAAGIEVCVLPIVLKSKDVKTKVIGTLHDWSFERAWYYWVCEGPGLDANAATELYEKNKNTVRVNGDCASPHPRIANHGMGTGVYHVDDQEGLNALAAMICRVVEENKAIVAASALVEDQ